MAAVDDYANTPPERRDAPPRHAAAVTPHNTNELSNVTRALRFGGAGNVVLVTAENEEVTITGIVAGETLVIQAKQVKATGTTATNITALW